MDTIKKIIVICDNRLEAIRKFNSFRKIASENYCPLYSMLACKLANRTVIKVFNNIMLKQIYQIEFISSECTESLQGYNPAFVVDATERLCAPDILHHVMGPDTRMIGYSELLNHFASTSTSKYALNSFYGLTSTCSSFESVPLVYNHSDSLDAFSYAIKRLGMHPSKSQIKKVIFNDPATIVYWEDGTKTVVKAMDGETFDKEKGLAMAISKKSLGNAGNYYDIFKEWITDESKK